MATGLYSGQKMLSPVLYYMTKTAEPRPRYDRSTEYLTLRTFTKAMLIAISFAAMQVVPAYAQSAKSANIGSNLRTLVHAVHTEATKSNVDEQLAVMMVVLNRADSGRYGSDRNLRAVVYNGEFNGPEDHPTPWIKEPAAFKKTEAVVSPYYERWVAHEALNIPAGAKCAEHAEYFDMRPHDNFGKKACRIGGTWFYYGATKVASNKKHHGKGVMTASSKRHGEQRLLAQNNTHKPKAVLTGKSDLRVASR